MITVAFHGPLEVGVRNLSEVHGSTLFTVSVNQKNGANCVTLFFHSKEELSLFAGGLFHNSMECLKEAGNGIVD